MAFSQFHLNVKHTVKGFDDEEWSNPDLRIVRAWEDVQKLYDKSKWKIMDEDCEISVDFSDCPEDILAYISALEKFFSDGSWNHISLYSKRKNYCRILINHPKKIHVNHIQVIVNYIFHEVFIVMNVAEPGSCNFFRSEIRNSDRTLEENSSYLRDDLHLSSYLFESTVGSKILPDSKVSSLSIETVRNWLWRVCKPYAMIAENPASKAVMAILHMVKIDAGPGMVVWIFYALESFLQCRAGENFSSLSSRISSVCGMGERENKIMKSNLRKLYDLRSSFVHGGHNIIHPLHNENLDEDVDKKFGEYLLLCDFGFLILILLIQKTIERGWIYPKFQEELSGDLIK